MENKYEYYTIVKLIYNNRDFYTFTGPHNIIKDSNAGNGSLFIQLKTHQSSLDNRILYFLLAFIISDNELSNDYNVKKLIEKLKKLEGKPSNKQPFMILNGGRYYEEYIGINMPYSKNLIKLAFLKLKPDKIQQGEISILDNNQIKQIKKKLNIQES